jgi:hypothetical protein
MSSWIDASTPDGWLGRRYMEGNEIFAEEFDSNGDSRIDIWRFYHRGVLTSEERDLSGNGRVDCVSRWDPRSHRLLSFGRDSRKRGVYDLEISRSGGRDWEIREDRNLDGITDRVLFIRGPDDLFERLGINLPIQEDLIDRIPMEFWRELWSDDSFTSVITDYSRFSRGRLTQYGEWEGNGVKWRRAKTGSPPPPSRSANIDGAAIPPDLTPTARGETTDPVPSVSEPYAEPVAAPYVIDSYPEEPRAAPERPTLSDRTRYDSLPPGESAARSLPAPMRPPGVGPRR